VTWDKTGHQLKHDQLRFCARAFDPRFCLDRHLPNKGPLEGPSGSEMSAKYSSVFHRQPGVWSDNQAPPTSARFFCEQPRGAFHTVRLVACDVIATNHKKHEKCSNVRKAWLANRKLIDGENGSVYTESRTTDVVEPETWNAVNKPVGGLNEVHCHDESDALTESRPVIRAPR